MHTARSTTLPSDYELFSSDNEEAVPLAADSSTASEKAVDEKANKIVAAVKSS